MRENGTIAPKASQPRPAEAYLSVNWLEFPDPNDRSRQLTMVRGVLAAKGRIGASARLALLAVGRTRETVRDGCSVDVSVQHEPEPADPSHCGIHGFAEEDIVVHDLLAGAVVEVHPAKDNAAP